MKQSVLRYAVSTVRWDAEQRIAIEAKLMQNVKQPVHPDDLDADEFIETDLVTMDDVMYEEDIEMEKKRVRRNIIIAILAAALLLTGGVAAAVAMQKHGGSHPAAESSARTELQSAESSRRESSVAEETRAFPALTLTDQTWNDLLSGVSHRYLRGGGPEWYTASEYGFYQRQNQRTGEADLSRDVAEAGTLLFTDGATAAHAVLCARPNCLHDGNEYCTATTTAYQPSELVYYDGYLYAAASKQNSKGEYEAGYVLRYEPDGSGITEVAHLDVHPQAELAAEPILHRGWLWVVYQDYSYVGTEMTDGITGDKTQTKTGGYVIFGYELATGKTTELLRKMPKEGSGQVYRAPWRNCWYADGDYLFMQCSGVWPAPHQGGCYAISLKTGELTLLPLKNNTSTDTNIWSVRGGLLFYGTKEGAGDNATAERRLYNMNTGEDMLCEEFKEIINLQTDGTYIYGFRQESSGDPMGADYRFTMYLQVYDMERNLLQSIPMPENDTYGIQHIKDGRLYLLYCNTEERGVRTDADPPAMPFHHAYVGNPRLQSCAISDLLNGDPQWKTELELVTAEAAYSP